MADKKRRKAVKNALKKEVDLPIKVPDNKLGQALTKKRSVFFAGYVSESWAELKKVTWPNRRETFRLMFAVIVFTALFTVYMSLSDYAITNVVERIFL